MPPLSARRWKTVGGIRAGLGLGRPAASKKTRKGLNHSTEEGEGLVDSKYTA